MDALLSFSDFVDFPLKCFKAYGLVPYKTTELGGSWKSKLFAVYHFLAMANAIMGILMMAVYIGKHIDDLALVTESSPYGYAAFAVIRSISISFRKEEFSDLMETLNDLFPKTTVEQKAFNIKNYLTDLKIIKRVFLSVQFSSAIGFFVVPVVQLIFTGAWNQKLPANTWYPFDEYDPRFYSFVYVWLSISGFNTMVILLATDFILYTFVNLISMQFDILCQLFRDLDNVPPTAAGNKLIELIKRHKTLIRLSDNLETIFSIPILFNFIGSSIQICLICYQLSLETSLVNFLNYAALLSYAILQIFMLCFYGNKLTTASENVADAVYDSGWNTRLQNKLDIALVLQMSQKPAVITAYKFSIVSLKVFRTVSWVN